MSYIFFDIETTSLKPPHRRPWELAFIDDKGHMQMFIHNVDLTGADSESLKKSKFYERHPDHNDLLSAVTWQEWYAAEWVSALTKNKTLVGCAPWFDEAVLTEMLERHNIKPQWNKCIDIQAVVKTHIGRTRTRPPRGLKACAEYLGIEYDPLAAHSALYDAKLAKQIFEKVA